VLIPAQYWAIASAAFAAPPQTRASACREDPETRIRYSGWRTPNNNGQSWKGTAPDMAKFTKMAPVDVVIGRGRQNAEERRRYVEALRTMDAGKIELQPNEKPTTVKRLLQEASKELGLKVRSTWTDEQQQTLVWKRISRRAAAAAPRGARTASR